MLFLIHFEFDPENRDKSLEQLKTSGEGMPEKVKTGGLMVRGNPAGGLVHR